MISLVLCLLMSSLRRSVVQSGPYKCVFVKQTLIGLLASSQTVLPAAVFRLATKASRSDDLVLNAVRWFV